MRLTKRKRHRGEKRVIILNAVKDLLLMLTMRFFAMLRMTRPRRELMFTAVITFV